MVKGERLLQIIDRSDTALLGMESAAVERVNSALETSYKQLEAKLLKAYSAQSGNLSLLPKQRQLLIQDEVKDLLSLMSTRNADRIQKDFENLLRGATESGDTLAGELAAAIANEKLSSFSSVPIEAVRFASENAVKRLSKHDAEFQEKATAIVLQGLVQGWGNQRVAGVMRAQLGVTKSKAETIARTETLAAHNEAASAAAQRNGFELFQLFSTNDARVCSYCAGRNQQVYRLGESQPPLHPRCRCYQVPVRQAWLDSGLIDAEWSRKFREEAIEELRATGKEPTEGLSPFEKAAGATKAPEAVWKPSQKPKVSAAPSREEILQRLTSELKQQALTDGSYKTLILKGGSTYDQTLEAEGKAAADRALEATLRAVASRQVDRELRIAEEAAARDAAIRQQRAARLEQERQRQQEQDRQAVQTFIRNGEKVVGQDLLNALDAALSPNSAIEAIKSQLEPLQAEFNKVFDADPLGVFRTPIGLRVLALEKQVKTLEQEQQTSVAETMQRIRQNLLESGIEESEAVEMAGRSKILKKALSQATEAEFRQELAEFYRITGGWGSDSLKKIIKSTNRAYASEDGELNIGSSSSRNEFRETLWHEAGHHVEFENDEFRKAALTWIQGRATEEPKQLNAISRVKAYEVDEVAYPDSFIHPYVGKFYTDGSTEVISMGLENFRSAEAMLNLYQRDREHFLLIIGMLRLAEED